MTPPELVTRSQWRQPRMYASYLRAGTCARPHVRASPASIVVSLACIVTSWHLAVGGGAWAHRRRKVLHQCQCQATSGDTIWPLGLKRKALEVVWEVKVREGASTEGASTEGALRGHPRLPCGARLACPVVSGSLKFCPNCRSRVGEASPGAAGGDRAG